MLKYIIFLALTSATQLTSLEQSEAERYHYSWHRYQPRFSLAQNFKKKAGKKHKKK